MKFGQKGVVINMLKISASSRFYTVYPGGSFSPLEMVEYFHRVGFEGIDYDLEAVTDCMSPDNWEKTLGEVANLAAKYGIRMDFGHLPFLKKNDKRAKDYYGLDSVFKWAIKAAGFAGIKNAVIHPIGTSIPYSELDPEVCFKENIDFLTPYVELAEKCGVKLAIENMRSPLEAEGKHRYGSTAEEIARMADYFGVGNCWDFGHANTSKVDQYSSLVYLGKRLTVLHVNDNHGDLDEHLLPFFGTVNWVKAMKGLKESGFDGCLNYECRMTRLPPAVRDEIGVYAVALGKKLQNLDNPDK